MEQLSTLVCDLDITGSVSVRLTVSPSAEIWIWSYILHSGEIIARGNTPTRLAAQVAVQRAHEAWLHRNRKRFNIPARVSYHWKEVE